MSEAIVSEITGFSTHDGPGIRTSVFVKGCPLRCLWCSNPETWTKKRQLFFHAARCQGCGRCAGACPEGAIDPRFGRPVDRSACTRCFACADVCLHRALEVSGTRLTAQEVFERVERDKPFYGARGGLTLSGGEPLSSPEFTRELFGLCKAAGISTVLDTTGFGSEEDLAEILKLTDLVLLDLKHMDPSEHERLTGVSNKTVLANAERIAATVDVRVSFPLVPGENDSDENLEATAAFCERLGVEWVDVNPLHALGEAKYQGLGLPSPYEGLRSPSPEEVARARAVMERHGLRTTVGRMM